MATSGATIRVMHLARGEQVGADGGRRRRTGTGKGLKRFFGPDEGQGGEHEQHLAEPDGGHHDQHPGPVEQPAQQQLATAPPPPAASPRASTRANQ